MKVKVCSKCKKELDKSLFYKNKKNLDGLDYYCKPCKRAQNLANYYKDKALQTEEEKQRKNKMRKIYYIENREKFRKRALEYYYKKKAEKSHAQ